MVTHYRVMGEPWMVVIIADRLSREGFRMGREKND